MNLNSIPLWEILLLVLAGFLILLVVVIWYFFGYNYAIVDIVPSIERAGNSTAGFLGALASAIF